MGWARPSLGFSFSQAEQNSVSGSSSTKFVFKDSLLGSGSTELKNQNTVSGPGWKNLNSFVPYGGGRSHD